MDKAVRTGATLASSQTTSSRVRAAGTTSSLDVHAHDHGVYVLHGRGRVRLSDDEHAIGPGDVVYVAPHDRHAFEADGDVALGFLCIVPARR